MDGPSITEHAAAAAAKAHAAADATAAADNRLACLESRLDSFLRRFETVRYAPRREANQQTLASP